MKVENGNKRTKRKEIQFSDEEYAVVERKANAARMPVAAFIREAALDKPLSAALSIEESKQMKRISAISYKMQVNLNQLAKLANSCGLPFVIDTIREYIVRTNEYFKTGVWREMDLTNYEAKQKQRDKLADKVKDLQERNDNLMRVSSTYYFYTAEGERLFCERYKCRMYPETGACSGISRSETTRHTACLRR